MRPPAKLAHELAPPEAIDLYLRLSNRLMADDVPDPESPALSWRETALLVGLVDAWRSHEHRKHIALKHALERAQRRLRRADSHLAERPSTPSARTPYNRKPL